jgi:5-formyltetrahydrofolate cyclo-ligase
MVDDQDRIRAWRHAQRAELLSKRLALTRDERRAASASCAARILEHIGDSIPACVSFYWPIKGEIPVRGVVESLLVKGTEAALPVVIAENRPMEFWAWEPGTTLQPGIWKIPVPAQRCLRHPDILLVPLLGFDEAGYRLGYGGGYYDRTLAHLSPRPRTIGVGFALGRLQTIYPQAHDIPMDAIVTEDGIHQI